MINDEVLKKFNIEGKTVHLDGGQGTSIRVGNAVFKPIENKHAHIFIASAWNQLEPKEYRVVKHLVSNNNEYIESGWAATEYEEMYEDTIALEKKLHASKHLHNDLRNLGIVTIPFSDDPWTRANKTLWHNVPYEQVLDAEVNSLCTMLLDSLEPVNDEYQLVHADLAGNTLFDKDGIPIIIDFSPAIAPAKYAHSILICDSIAWKNASIESLNLLEPFEDYKEFIKYAIAFRVLTAAYQVGDSFPDALTEWQAYKKIWDYVQQ